MNQVDWNSEAAKKTAAAIRVLAADAVEKANSGHPGMPLGAADMALVLWTSYLNFNPEEPNWLNRDRFILSAGHGSMLLYALLHLFGYELSLEDIKNFRQWGSKTPGHPEYGLTPGVETTTGPLGQGFANGVGMAIAARFLAERLNTKKYPLISHRIMGIVSDGDLMEGVAAEAASIAGHLGLGNIIYLYDDNQVTIEGPTALAFSENVKKRFEAYRWQVLTVDGHDRAAVDRAIKAAITETRKPSLIMARTRIGYGCPNLEGSEKTHGAPLGPEELQAMKKCLGWEQPEFSLPGEVYDFCRKALAPKQEAYRQWKEMLDAYQKEEPRRAKLLHAFLSGEIPKGLEKKVLAALPDKPLATRKASGAVLQALSENLPFLLGGSADLAPSNNTLIKEGKAGKVRSLSRRSFKGRNLHYGVREHAMGSISNGMALYGLIPYAGTFLVFSDYMRPAIRLSALMGLRVIYVFTHDSIFVGEDGPTHQPVEHLAALRAIPGLRVIRPADAAETAVAWLVALERRDGPTALALSRQTLPLIDRKKFAPPQGLRRGGYVLAGEEKESPDLILIATGSEVSLAIEVYEEFIARGVKARVVSMPCMELFEEQEESYRLSVLPPGCRRRVAMEAGVSFGWHKWTGPEGIVIGVERFGASAPYKVLAEKFGFVKTAVLDKIQNAFPELF